MGKEGMSGRRKGRSKRKVEEQDGILIQISECRRNENGRIRDGKGENYIELRRISDQTDSRVQAGRSGLNLSRSFRKQAGYQLTQSKQM